MKYTNYILLFVNVLALTGCYKDKGNYIYTEKPGIEIGGIQDSYRKTAMLDDPNLVIPVTINTEYPTTELQYVWTIGLEGGNTVDTVSRDKDLRFDIENAPVSLRPGTYNIVLAVARKTAADQDNERAYTVYKTSTLLVETRFSRGFYVLKQTPEGNTDMDFVIMEDDFGKLDLESTPAVFKVEDFASGVLSQALRSQLEGKPQVLAQLTHHPYIDPLTNVRESSHCLGITTERTTAVVRCRDMVLIGDHENTFWDPAAASGKPGRFMRSNGQSMYVSTDGYYGLPSGENAVGTGRFGPPAEVPGQGGSKWIAPLHSLYSQLFIVWDEVNGRFMLLTSMNTSTSVTLYAGSGNPDAPQPNGITDHLLFMGTHHLTMDFIYAITQPKNGGARKIYSLSRLSNRPETPIDWVVTFPASSKFNSATSYALNTWDAKMLYGVSGGELYSAMLGNSEEAALGPEERLNLQGLPAGEQVTYVANRFWWSRSDPTFKFNYLVVGTSAGDGTYTISMYQMIGGKPLGMPKVQFSGEGVVADVQYMAPQGGGSTDMFGPVFGDPSYGLSY